MSVAEIKEAMRALSPGELADVAEYAATLRAEITIESAPGAKLIDPESPEFLRVMDGVFTDHRDLMHRLAQ